MRLEIQPTFVSSFSLFLVHSSPFLSGITQFILHYDMYSGIYQRFFFIPAGVCSKCANPNHLPL